MRAAISYPRCGGRDTAASMASLASTVAPLNVSDRTRISAEAARLSRPRAGTAKRTAPPRSGAEKT